MNHELQITEVTSIDHTLLDELSTLLINVVHGGAAIGFLPPVSQEEAREYWEHVLDPSVILLVARLNGQLCGTIQLHLAQKTNGTHRAEVAKLMVHPDQRRNGIARALLNTVDSRAKLEGRSLLVLYTREGDPSNLLYQSHEYIEAGRILISLGQLMVVYIRTFFIINCWDRSPVKTYSDVRSARFLQ